MAYLRLELYKKVTSPDLETSDPNEYKSYKEVLSLDGGRSFATATELTIQKKDGSVFRSALEHYESDFLTETYLGHFENGTPFRFVFASKNNPFASLNPMVSFAGLSKTSWAVHFYVKP